MHDEQNHLIREYRIELKLWNEKSAFQAQQRFLSAAKNIVTDKLESLFDQFAESKRYLRIARLEINLGTIHESVLEETISNTVPAIIEEELRKLLPGGSQETNPERIHPERGQDQPLLTEVLEHPQYVLSWFFHFLNHGSFPWWAPQIDFHSFEKEIIHVFHSRQNNLTRRVMGGLKGDGDAIERLVLQFSEDFLVELISFFMSGKEEPVIETVNALKAISLENKVHITPEPLKMWIYLPIFKTFASFGFQVDSSQEWLKAVLDHMQWDRTTTTRIDIVQGLGAQFNKIENHEIRNGLIQAIHLILNEESQRQSGRPSDVNWEKRKPAFSKDGTRRAGAQNRDIDNESIDHYEEVSKSLTHPDKEEPRDQVSQGRENKNGITLIDRNQEVSKSRTYPDREEPRNQMSQGRENKNGITSQDDSPLRTYTQRNFPQETTRIRGQETNTGKILISKEKREKDEDENTDKHCNARPMKHKETDVVSERSVPSLQSGFKSMKEMSADIHNEKDDPRLKNDGITSELSTKDSPAALHSNDPFIFMETKEDAAYYIRNAGLVILAPFFPQFFQELRLLKHKEFKDKEAACRAVHILQHLVDNADRQPENQLVLNKILCGIPVERPIERDINLTDHERACVLDLLNSAIKHWTALKGSSADGLREGFLQRQGKLVELENDWKLIVERKTLDILLSKIPWGFSMIRHPWMSSWVNVEW